MKEEKLNNLIDEQNIAMKEAIETGLDLKVSDCRKPGNSIREYVCIIIAPKMVHQDARKLLKS